MGTRLKEIIVSVTNRCNLRCKMCQISQIDNNGEMTTAEIKELIKDAANLNPNSIVFSGGEPLLREDIFELIAFTNKYKINTCLTSNGTLINDDVAKKLSSSGIGVVNISIEGPEEIHDVLRGKGSYNKALTALKFLLNHKIESTIATVVLRQNYKFMDFILELAHKIGVTTVKFQPFSEIFLIEKAIGKDFFISSDELEDIKTAVRKTINLAQMYKIATNPQGYLWGIPLYLAGIQKESLHCGCIALTETCPVSPNGDIYLCWVLSNKVLGNIKLTKLSQLWNSELHQQLRDLVRKEGCPSCLMSCYDYNFGNYSFWETINLKAKKFKNPKFYIRMHHKIYQYTSYLLRKLMNYSVFLQSKIFRNFYDYHKRDFYRVNLLEEIKVAKDMLETKLRYFKKNERG